jgi:hypothetical protein
MNDINNWTILILGDPFTGKRLRSLLESRKIKRTPWHQLAFIVYVLGLFHFKMAAADAIHRIFIAPLSSRHDSNGLLQYVGQIWPKETGKITSKPGFCRMHEVIQHVGIISWLQCWARYANEKFKHELLRFFPSEIWQVGLRSSFYFYFLLVSTDVSPSVSSSVSYIVSPPF